MRDHWLTVVTGLPASGKSTVGELLSRELGLALIDKDTILEALFDSLGCPDPEARTRLSRRVQRTINLAAGLVLIAFGLAATGSIRL